MIWTKGHIWVLDVPITQKVCEFKYKYVLLDKSKKGGQMAKWEQGIDRIAELSLLPELTIQEFNN